MLFCTFRNVTCCLDMQLRRRTHQRKDSSVAGSIKKKPATFSGLHGADNEIVNNNSTEEVSTQHSITFLVR